MVAMPHWHTNGRNSIQKNASQSSLGERDVLDLV